jgi:hypothetical protein
VHFRKQTEFEYNFAQVFKPNAPSAREWRVARQGCWNAYAGVVFAASIILPEGAATVYCISQRAGSLEVVTNAHRLYNTTKAKMARVIIISRMACSAHFRRRKTKQYA